MPLRDYQIEALEAIRSNWLAGVNKQLVVVPTGGGKTEIFAHLPQAIGLEPGKTLMVLVHRNELVDQAADRMARYNPKLKVGIERSDLVSDADCDIVVASVASIGRTDPNNPEGFSSRLRRFDSYRLKYLIIDEIHHGVNEIYANVMRYFKLYKPDPKYDEPGRLLLGVTATPNRGDNIGLESILDKIVFSRDIREMISAGWLTDISAFRVETQVELDNVRSSHGDFQIRDLERTVNVPERNRLIVEKYRELGGGRPAIAFTTDVAHSHDLAAEFRRLGITALPLSGMTPDDERKRIFRSHQSRETTVLVSCGIINEGVDVPWVEVGMMARPTRSKLLFTQQLGRLLRPWPSPESGLERIKKCAVVIDFCDVCVKHRLVSVPSLFGLRADFNLKGSKIVPAVEEIEKAQEKARQLKIDGFRDLETLRSIVSKIDLFKPPTVPEIARQHSKLAWLEGFGSTYRLSLPSKLVLSIRQNALGGYEVSESRDGLRSVICDNVNVMQTAFRIADSRVSGDDRRVLLSDAAWRNESPSSKQVLALKKLYPDMFDRCGRDITKFEAYIRSSFTRGDCSALISERIASR